MVRGKDLAEKRPDWSIVVRCISAALGANVGNQTSYQSSLANLAFGTPRGGRRTVPMRSPSPRRRVLPSRTILMAIGDLVRYCHADARARVSDPCFRRGQRDDPSRPH